MTNSSSNCPDCGTALPEDSPQHLCPSCLMKQAFVSRTADQGPSQALPPSPEEIADKFPQFEITECLGRGGMGVVYKARQKSLNRWVAIKVLAPERVDDEKFAERFTREAQTLAQLNHPNIVTVHDYGETDGLYFIVMEFVDGVNLRDLLHDGKIDSAQALNIVPPICEALQYAHDKGIVHRDIKPENLLIDRDGRVKIADFGIASLVGSTDEQSGTPPYMAPEQGAHTHVDHRADIYALGAVLYEMLTGDRPATPLNLPSQKVELDIRIDDIVLRALSKEPERRYRNAHEFQTVVETISESSTAPVKATPTPSVTPPPPSLPEKGLFRRWWWIFLIMVPISPLLGIAIGLYFQALTPKSYQASTTIQIVPKENTLQPSYNTEQYIDAFISDESLEKVIKKNNLSHRRKLSMPEAVESLRDSITIVSIRGTDLLEIRVRWTNGAEAAGIANSLTKVHTDESLPYKVTVHQLATNPGTPISSSRKIILISAPIGLLLSPILALAFAALLHRLFPQNQPRPSDPRARSLYRNLAIGLFLVGILGTLAMMTLSHRHDMALIFGAVALFLSLVCGLKSNRSGAVKVLIVIIAIIGILSFIASALIWAYRSTEHRSLALAEAEKVRQLEAVAKSRREKADQSSMKFGPTMIREITAPISSRQACFLDLDTGKLIDVPAEIYPLVKHRFNAAVSKPVDVDRKIGAWARDTGADLMISMTDPATHLALYGSNTIASTSQFEEASPADTIQRVTKKPSAESRGKIPAPFISFSSPNSYDSEAIVFRTREGAIGVLTVLGTSESPKRVKVAFKLLAKSKPQGQQFRGLSFGPIIERIVYDDRPDATETMIDFDTGRLITPPSPEIADWEWTKANGIDAIGCTDTDVLGLLSTGGTVIVPTTEEAWLNPSVAQVRQIAIPLSATEQGSVAIPGTEGFPSTFIFKTRGRALGLLQIVGLTGDSSATKIRYRLIVDKDNPMTKAEDDFERVARLHMEAVSQMDLKAARAFWIPYTELAKKTDAECLPNMRETNRAFEKDPALITTFSEWYRIGGYALARVTPPEQSDGRSIYLILGHSPNGWGIIKIDDIRQDESLSDKFEEYAESH